MPRFCFNFRKDSHDLEEVSVELADAHEAQVEAVRSLAEDMRDNPEQLWNDEDWHVEVIDESGLVLFTTSSAAHCSTAGKLTSGRAAAGRKVTET